MDLYRRENKTSPIQLWNSYYESLQKDEPLPPPASIVENYFHILKKNTVLDIAMGLGGNALFLAEKGFDVQGIDGSHFAIEFAKRWSEKKKLTLQTKVIDLDFYLMPLMKFDSIIMIDFKPMPRFFSEILRGLLSGGVFMLEAYTTMEYKSRIKSAPQTTLPNTPPCTYENCFSPNEALHLSKDFEILYYHEIQLASPFKVSLIARKK